MADIFGEGYLGKAVRISPSDVIHIMVALLVLLVDKLKCLQFEFFFSNSFLKNDYLCGILFYYNPTQSGDSTCDVIKIPPVSTVLLKLSLYYSYISFVSDTDIVHCKLLNLVDGLCLTGPGPSVGHMTPAAGN